MSKKRARPGRPTRDQRSRRPAAGGGPLESTDFDGVLEKLKLLEFGLYGLQQLGRNAALDLEDIGPFTRLAEEIESDVLELQRRLRAPESPAGARGV